MGSVEVPELKLRVVNRGCPTLSAGFAESVEFLILLSSTSLSRWKVVPFYYASAKFKFSIASSISAVFL